MPEEPKLDLKEVIATATVMASSCHDLLRAIKNLKLIQPEKLSLSLFHAQHLIHALNAIKFPEKQ